MADTARPVTTGPPLPAPRTPLRLVTDRATTYAPASYPREQYAHALPAPEPYALDPAHCDTALDVRVEEAGASARVYLRGELDLATSALLDGILEDLLRPSRSPRLRHLCVSTAAVTFADAAGISPLLHARAVLARRSGAVELPDASPVIRRLLGLLDLTSLLRS
jgi:anti-anti-sigma factor